MTTHFNENTVNATGSFSRRIVLVSLFAITMLGFYLRYRCLGCLGFRWDEDLTALAVKALIENGVPELPSGMVYLRFYPYQWITAASVKVFGFSEFSMRLPSVVFGTLLVPLAYAVSSKLFSKTVGLIVAVCIALSFWQVEMARTARMYAPFFFTYLLAAYAIFHCHYQDNGKVFSPWVPLFALLALTIHQLAYSLALILLLAIPLQRSTARTVSLVAQAAAIGMAFIVVNRTQQHYFNIPRKLVESGDQAGSPIEASGVLGALLQQVSLPELNLLSQLIDTHAMILGVIAVPVVLLAIRIIRPVWASGLVYQGMVVLATLLALAHQFNLVLVTLALILIHLRIGIRGLRHPAWYRPALLYLIILLLWLAAIAIIAFVNPSDIELASRGPRKLLRALVDYPNFRLFWSFVFERPLLSIPLALGTLWSIDKIARDRPDHVALFLFGSFWVVLFANGVLNTKFEFFRYSLHVDPFFFMLVVAGLLATPYLLAEMGVSQARRFNERSWKVTGTWIIAAIAIVGVNPLGAVLTSARHYTESEFPYPALGLDQYVDFKTPAQFVAERIRKDDLVLVMDPREYWNYLGRVDYWIRSTDYESQTYQDRGRARDLYLGIPLIHSLEELEAAITNHSGGNVWILYSKARLARTPSISPEIKTYLAGLSGHIVYTGHDEQTIVIRLVGKQTEE
jgi:hypothetical protein